MNIYHLIRGKVLPHFTAGQSTKKPPLNIVHLITTFRVLTPFHLAFLLFSKIETTLLQSANTQLFVTMTTTWLHRVTTFSALVYFVFSVLNYYNINLYCIYVLNNNMFQVYIDCQLPTTMIYITLVSSYRSGWDALSTVIKFWEKN